jgi:uncharacterized protein (DUF2147 family)
MASQPLERDTMNPRLLLLAALSAGAVGATAAHAADPRGRYLTASGNFEVELARCGDALCGSVSKVIANHSMSRPGEAMQAADARDPMGLRLLSNFVADGDATNGATQWRGDIHNRENGKTYSCLMSLDARGDLVLRAYVGLPLFGKTQVWQRLGGPESGTGAATGVSPSASPGAASRPSASASASALTRAFSGSATPPSTTTTAAGAAR